ncbi:MAG: hypothetical protein ACYDAL_04970 [Candidatus Dormibacteraceae bacterium]
MWCSNSSLTSGATDCTTSVSTYDGGSNPGHFQQQVAASQAIR